MALFYNYGFTGQQYMFNMQHRTYVPTYISSYRDSSTRLTLEHGDYMAPPDARAENKEPVDVFLNYSAKDYKRLAEPIEKALTDLFNLSVFVARDSAPETTDAERSAAIYSCTVGVSLFSSNFFYHEDGFSSMAEFSTLLKRELYEKTELIVPVLYRAAKSRVNEKLPSRVRFFSEDVQSPPFNVDVLGRDIVEIEDQAKLDSLIAESVVPSILAKCHPEFKGKSLREISEQTAATTLQYLAELREQQKEEADDLEDEMLDSVTVASAVQQSSVRAEYEVDEADEVDDYDDDEGYGSYMYQPISDPFRERRLAKGWRPKYY